MARTKPKTSLYFTTIAALPDDAVIVGGHLVVEESDPTATILLKFQGGNWTLLSRVDEVIYAITSRSTGDAGALGREGLFLEIAPGGQLHHRPILRKDVTYLEDLTYLTGTYYACGGSRQAYQSTPSGWSSIDADIYVHYTPGGNISLLSIDGFDKERIYVCGTGGYMAIWNGRSWRQLDTPTNVDLHSVLCARSGNIYVCGAAGMIFRLDANDVWHDLTDDASTDRSLWDMVEFGDRLYIAAGDRLLATDGSTFEVVDVPTEEEPAIYRLAANQSLWCVGDELLYEFDGARWIFHVCPANR